MQLTQLFDTRLSNWEQAFAALIFLNKDKLSDFALTKDVLSRIEALISKLVELPDIWSRELALEAWNSWNACEPNETDCLKEVNTGFNKQSFTQIEATAAQFLSQGLEDSVSLIVEKEAKSPKLYWHTLNTADTKLFFSFEQESLGLGFMQLEYLFAKRLKLVHKPQYLLAEASLMQLNHAYAAWLIRSDGRRFKIWLALQGNLSDYQTNLAVLKMLKIKCQLWVSKEDQDALLCTPWARFKIIPNKQENKLSLIIKESIMKEHEVKEKFERLNVKIFLGEISLSAWDAMQLRAGQTIEIDCPTAFDAAIEVGGETWFKTKLQFQGEKIELKVEEACFL